MLKTTLAALALALVASAAAAQTLTPEDFIHRHMDFAAKGDADAIANDFAPDGASVSANGTAVGREAIRAQFARLVGARKPAASGAAPAGGGGGMGGMKVDKIWSEGNVGFINWEAGPVHATEVFVIHDGKIQSQSVFMNGPPPGPPPPKPAG
jgi:hypothetical protein